MPIQLSKPPVPVTLETGDTVYLREPTPKDFFEARELAGGDEAMAAYLMAVRCVQDEHGNPLFQDPREGLEKIGISAANRLSKALTQFLTLSEEIKKN
ncbi:MAG: hypothetical protein RMJ19_03280 [Gemmatales bacterium]|nr:phage tail assembly protein [Gemmatales bacterium]MDW8174671.1 hypothetical protein [Gemmatales bacterium]